MHGYDRVHSYKSFNNCKIFTYRKCEAQRENDFYVI